MKTATLENVEGLDVGDLVQHEGDFWKVAHVSGQTATIRTLNAFERVRLGFAQWRQRKKK